MICASSVTDVRLERNVDDPRARVAGNRSPVRGVGSSAKGCFQGWVLEAAGLQKDDIVTDLGGRDIANFPVILLLVSSSGGRRARRHSTGSAEKHTRGG